MKPVEPITNRERLVRRLQRLARLVEVAAPAGLLYGAKRLIEESWMDAIEHGLDSTTSHRELVECARREVDAEEREHEKHLDGKPVDGCTFCLDLGTESGSCS